jgi:riboflavin synthase
VARFGKICGITSAYPRESDGLRLGGGEIQGLLLANMFTGIVEETGSVQTFEPRAEAWRLVISARAALADLSAGDSIAVNGCCLTATQFDGHALQFDVLAETRRLTNFSALAPGALVNLERSLRFGGKVGGHFVTGHIDALGTIGVLETRGKDVYLRVQLPPGTTRYVVRKGSIAIDGISLTIAEVTADYLAVWLIPHTLAVTNLRGKRVGDQVNLEFDLLGKHIEKLMQTGLEFSR